MRSSTCCRIWACRHGNASECRWCPARRVNCWPPATSHIPPASTPGAPSAPRALPRSAIDRPPHGPQTFPMAAPKITSDTPAASPVADFEQSLDALEQLVEQMERGDLSLEESLSA